MAGKPRVKIPKSVAAGDVITIKTLIKHKMESGQRKDGDGNVIPRDIINKFEATFNGKPVFSASMAPAISANPYIEFSSRVDEAGTFLMQWTDDAGTVTETTEDITLKG